MGLHIRDDTVRDLARRLAGKRRITVTEAVRQALEHELDLVERDLDRRDRQIREIWSELDAMPRLGEFGDDDRYDGHGVPIARASRFSRSRPTTCR
ncbi:MAG TPA: type II toxin-antitoxin system VapB family antitoxin [Geminicoccaceae bacterium]